MENYTWMTSRMTFRNPKGQIKMPSWNSVLPGSVQTRCFPCHAQHILPHQRRQSEFFTISSSQSHKQFNFLMWKHGIIRHYLNRKPLKIPVYKLYYYNEYNVEWDQKYLKLKVRTFLHCNMKRLTLIKNNVVWTKKEKN